jgi:hypothetical protein
MLSRSNFINIPIGDEKIFWLDELVVAQTHAFNLPFITACCCAVFEKIIHKI